MKGKDNDKIPPSTRETYILVKQRWLNPNDFKVREYETHKKRKDELKFIFSKNLFEVSPTQEPHCSLPY